MSDDEVYNLVIQQIEHTRVANIMAGKKPWLICTNITRPMWNSVQRAMESYGFFHFPLAGPKPPGVPVIMFNGSSIKIIEHEELWAVSYAV